MRKYSILAKVETKIQNLMFVYIMDVLKAIETGMILLIMDIKNYFYVFFQRRINFAV